MQAPIKIYGCEEWGSRAPRSMAAATKPTDQVLHHTTDPNHGHLVDLNGRGFASANDALQFDFALARRIQAFHMDVKGWSDSGQDFLVTINGNCLEGRHGALAAALAGHCIRGAHAADPTVGVYDNNSWGTEHEGNYMKTPWPLALWLTSVELQAWLSIQTSLDINTIKGHRDTGIATQCPGDWMYGSFDGHITSWAKDYVSVGATNMDVFRAHCHAVKLSLLQSHH